MASEKEKLYETLGELLFAIAKADGVIQEEEKEALNKLLERHTWAAEIKWSFDYESNKNASIEEVYNKVLNYCHSYGPAPEYEEFIDAMKTIAQATEGVEERESSIIESFSKDLTARFQRDIERFGKIR